MNVIDQYAEDVVAGRIPAGKYHRASCLRHLKDRTREGSAGFPYRFDLAQAERFFRFAEKLKHYKGEWAGQPIRLECWQKFTLGSIFGWRHTGGEAPLHADRIADASSRLGIRRFRTAYKEVPRKNGKSLEAAVVMLYVTFYDGEPGAEGYCIATKRDQAKLVFRDCQQLVRSSGLKAHIAVQVANLHRDATASKLEPLGADHDSTDGLNPNAVCADELHAYKDRGLLDVMETATGARRQPLFFKITTAGDDPVSPGGDEHDYACKILDGVLVDETYFAFIAHADTGDPWESLETARKANPNYGVSVKPDDLTALVTKAQGIPSASATYKQKRLNLWVNTFAPCLSVDGWRKGQQRPAWTLEDMAHEACYVGVDLASKIDLCAVAFVFPPTVGRGYWRVFQRIWTPQDTLIEREHRDRAPYSVWVDQGWLTAVPGKTIDKQVVRDAILEARDVVDIQQIGFDPWHDETPIQQLVSVDGFAQTQVIEVPQTFAGMSGGCLRMQADILAGDVDARGCPVTGWSVSNAVGSFDGKGNLMFTKDPKKMKGRIDPLIAMTIGAALFVRQPPVEHSVYLTRGVRTLGE